METGDDAAQAGKAEVRALMEVVRQYRHAMLDISGQGETAGYLL